MVGVKNNNYFNALQNCKIITLVVNKRQDENGVK
jgi:hypothetical protein